METGSLHVIYIKPISQTGKPKEDKLATDLFLFNSHICGTRNFLGLGVESELHCSFATVTAMPNRSQICQSHRSLQPWILNPLSKARDRTHILTDTMSGLQPAEPQQELLAQDFRIINALQGNENSGP